jgi:hypothetical protein
LCVTCALALFAQTPDGLTCETAIPVNSTYTGSIPAPGTYYFTAWTYDLPLTCYFYPDGGSLTDLYMDVDFSCTNGVYEDPNIQELLDVSTGWGIKIPIRFDDFIQSTDEFGRTYYYRSFDKTYRELMANFGVSYDVQAFVTVYTSTAGKITMKPDDTFRNCVENSTWLTLPTTVQVDMLSSEDSYVLPLADWQNDSIRFVWNGKSAPVQVWIGAECDFNLSLSGDNAAINKFELQPDAGNGENIYVMSKKAIIDFINYYEKGGIYYVRFASIEDAELVLEKQPISGPMADAIRLEVNESVKVAANDAEQVYYFPIEWNKRNIQFVSSVNTPVKAYFASDVVFEANDSESKLIATKDFVNQDGEMQLSLSEKELSTLCEAVSGDFVFVKFVANKSTTITPLYWDACYCAKNSSEIYTEDYVAIPRRNTTGVWRIYYDDWKKHDVKFCWNATSSMKMYIMDTCVVDAVSDKDPSNLFYKQFTVRSGKSDTLTITSEQWKSWADRVSEDGYLYFRFNANSVGNLSVTSTLVDIPVIPSSPCVANSIELKANDQLTLNLDSAFTVYRINYNEWVATGATLTWTGVEPLHTFVAETCEFAVAPYNKYVHAYVSVPAEGVAVLDAAKLAEMAAYVDEDGYLYVRFLTEKEGVLIVK